MRFRIRFLPAFVGLALAFGAARPGAQAVPTEVWTPVAGSTDFTDPANWFDGTNHLLPGPLANGGVLNAGTVDLTVPASVAMANAALNFTIGGGSGTTNLAVAPSATLSLGSFFVTGGTVNQTGAVDLSEFAVGSGSGNSGTYALSSGSITVDTSSANSPTPTLRVGDFLGTGVFNQTGGTVTVGTPTLGASLTIGNQGGHGTYNLSGGLLQEVRGMLDLGRVGSATYAPGSGALNVSGGTLEIGAAGELILGGNISTAPQGTGVLTQTGGVVQIDAGGAFFLSSFGAGTYHLDGGLLQVGGTGLQSIYNNGIAGTFTLGGGTVQASGSALTTAAGASLDTGTTSTFDTNGLGITWQGVLSGAGGLAKTGAGTLALTGANTFTGLLTVGQGTLQAASDANLGGASASLALLNGASLATTATFASARSVSLGSGGGVLVPGAGTRLTLSGAIGGSGGLTQHGAGTVVLTGAAAYAGPTSIDGGGALYLAHSPAGAVSVVSGSLGGPGAATGTMGTLSLSSLALTLGASTLDFDLGTAGLSDTFDVGGALSLSGTGTVGLKLTDLSGGALSGTYTLLEWTGGAATLSLSQFALDPGSSPAFTAADLQVNGDSLQYVVVAAAPEPAPWLLGGAGLFALLVLRRRRASSL